MIIENSKTYNVNEVENLFFRPSFCGKSAEELGIRVLYNMPIPTKLPLFGNKHNILKEFSSGWQGEIHHDYRETEIPMAKLKAENSYSAEAYFSTIYELLTNSADVNLGDLTGTDLEKAETEIFRRAIVESIYATMWFGDESGEVSNLTGFSGFIRKIIDIYDNDSSNSSVIVFEEDTEAAADMIFQEVWEQAKDDLRSIATEGNLAYFVSSDIYDAYHFWLEHQGFTSAIADTNNTRPTLAFHGIPVVEIPARKYDTNRAKSFCILTDRRNLVLALNTADSPEKEIHMWYNPDEMENRQRVVFLAGTAIADKDILSAYIYDADLTL
ncbi:MAG: hypothetical protein IKL20_00140 [Alistipes sp.]|nr:hypothetical protein [Alistipes sp.]